MLNITAIGDITTHSGAPLVLEPTNKKITFNNIFLCLQGAQVITHSLGVQVHPIPVIIDTIQHKVFYNNIPFSVYTSIASCGTVVVGSQINPKVFITP